MTSGKVVITGANGNLGRKLVSTLGEAAIAVVRSERAANMLPDNADVRVLSYTDAAALAEPLSEADAVVHLVGIIKESAGNTYEQAHEATALALAAAAEQAGAPHIVYLSILGSEAGSNNACLASKGRAEDTLLAEAQTTVLQVPMVLGEGDYATHALRRRATTRISVTFRAESLEQPIDAEDVVQAIVSACEKRPAGRWQLAGPESLTRRSLYQRAANVLGRSTRVFSLPVSLGYAMAGLLEKVSSNPPITRAMLGVLDHDDQVDPTAAAEALGIRLTPLQQTLEKLLR